MSVPRPSALARLTRRATRTLRDEEGSVAMEAVIILPVLVFFYIVSFTFYDAYRKQTVITKAGYTVADMLSRQPTTVAAADIDGLREIFAYITRADEDAYIRVTKVTRYVDDTLGIDEYRVLDSYGTNGTPQMTQTELDGTLVNVPMLSDNETVTVVETFYPYVPPFFIGLDAYTMTGFVVTRQRTGLPIDLDVPPLGT